MRRLVGEGEHGAFVEGHRARHAIADRLGHHDLFREGAVLGQRHRVIARAQARDAFADRADHARDLLARAEGPRRQELVAALHHHHVGKLMPHARASISTSPRAGTGSGTVRSVLRQRAVLADDDCAHAGQRAASGRLGASGRLMRASRALWRRARGAPARRPCRRAPRRAPADVEVRRQPGAFEERDRPFGVAQAKLQGGVHVVGGREPFVQAPQCRVEVRPDQPVYDAAGKIVAHRDGEPCVLEHLLRGGERGGHGVGLLHQFHELRGSAAPRRKRAKPSTFEPSVPRDSPVCTPRHSVPSSRHDGGVLVTVRDAREAVRHIRADDDDHVARRRRALRERVRGGKRAALAGVDHAVGHRQAPNIFESL